MCSNVTSLPELVANGCGLLFDPMSAEDIADKMETWLIQPEARLEAATRGQRRARRENNLLSYATRLASLYKSVVAQVAVR
jgi:glycosyltransferase involved in cell wall biosynthesis